MEKYKKAIILDMDETLEHGMFKKKYSFNEEDLIIENIPEGMTVTMIDVPEYTEFEITGVVSKVRQAMTNKITGVVDMDKVVSSTGLSAWLKGTYSVEVALNLPEGVENTPIKITIEVEKNS